MARVLVSTIENNRRNLIINGGFDFSQRDPGVVGIGGGFGYQTADRWQLGHNTGDKTSQTSAVQGSGGPPISISNEVTNNLLFQSTHTGSLGDLQCRQFVEKKNTAGLVGDKMSFSVWLKSDSAARVRIIFAKAVTDDTFTGKVDFHTYENATFDNSDTWTEVKIEDIDVPVDADHGISVTILFDDFQNITGTRNHRVAAVMMNKGRNSAPFQRAGITVNDEVALCQRYYEKSADIDAAVNQGNGRVLGFARNDGNIFSSENFAVTKRRIPTIGVQSGSTGSVGIGTVGFNGFNIQGGIAANGSYELRWTADAEIS